MIAVCVLYKMRLAVMSIPEIPQGDKDDHIQKYVLKITCDKMLRGDIPVDAHMGRQLDIQYQDSHYYGKDPVDEGAQAVRQFFVMRYIVQLDLL